MKNSTRRILSLALASTIVAGTPVAAKACDEKKIEIVYDGVDDYVNYTIADGDTLGKIAKTFLGNEAYYNYLAEYNHLDNPNNLSIGQVIKIPKNIINFQGVNFIEQPNQDQVYDEDGKYTVNCGDTLDCIVRVWYGSESRELVDKLATYNNLPDPNKISVGQVLLMPSIERLQLVVANDYTCEYNRMGLLQNYKNNCQNRCDWIYNDSCQFVNQSTYCYQYLVPQQSITWLLVPVQQYEIQQCYVQSVQPEKCPCKTLKR